MRVGVVIYPQFDPADTIRRWKSLEERGFDHGWTYDHLAWRDLADQDWYATIPTLTLAATATKRLQLGAWVFSPNFRHPVPLAKELMTLQAISDGRLVPILGAGGTGWDAEVLGQPALNPRQRVDRLAEFATVLDLLLSNAETTWSGEYFHAVRARMNPAGSRARTPLLLAGNGPRSVRLAARYDGWVTIGMDTPAAQQWWAGLATAADTYTRAGGSGRRMLSLDELPGYDHSSVECFTDAAGRAAELGFTDVVIHWPRPEEPHRGEEKVLDRIADRLQPHR